MIMENQKNRDKFEPLYFICCKKQICGKRKETGHEQHAGPEADA